MEGRRFFTRIYTHRSWHTQPFICSRGVCDHAPSENLGLYKCILEHSSAQIGYFCFLRRACACRLRHPLDPPLTYAFFHTLWELCDLEDRSKCGLGN